MLKVNFIQDYREAKEAALAALDRAATLPDGTKSKDWKNFNLHNASITIFPLSPEEMMRLDKLAINKFITENKEDSFYLSVSVSYKPSDTIDVKLQIVYQDQLDTTDLFNLPLHTSFLAYYYQDETNCYVVDVIILTPTLREHLENFITNTIIKDYNITPSDLENDYEV